MKTETTAIETHWTTRCAAFGGPVQTHRVRIEHGEVRIFDPIGGYYTLCHGLSARTVARILRRAAAAQSR